ncbi:hypothetical protein H6P81_020001 [Aristolochia fimbriata]|uniref:Uncharacterized protein n=1 Tax=Aristolochia fimbriata TaxID=158543 RepID=A0AAV7DUG5_ARIFI|nr:hypothetical protein H6P81_020001 [Aristolochia fimbriata]
MVYVLTVDVPSSNSALQSMLQAHGVPHDHGSWDMGWSLAPLNGDKNGQLTMDAVRTQFELKQGPGPRIKGIKFWMNEVILVLWLCQQLELPCWGFYIKLKGSPTN